MGSHPQPLTAFLAALPCPHASASVKARSSLVHQFYIGGRCRQWFLAILNWGFREDIVHKCRPFRRAFLIVGLALVPLVPHAAAQQGGLTIQLNLVQMADESENVVLGRVTSVKAEPHPQFENLDTVVITLEVLEALKGSPGRQLTFRQYVFDVTDRNSKLGYRVGEEMLLLLRRPSQYGLTSPVGFEQGRFRVERGAANIRMLRNGNDNAALFEGLDQTAPALRLSLSQPLQQLVIEHQSGPISYDQVKSFVQSALAASQGAQ